MSNNKDINDINVVIGLPKMVYAQIWESSYYNRTQKNCVASHVASNENLYVQVKFWIYLSFFASEY